jgi:hypothetical protein
MFTSWKALGLAAVAAFALAACDRSQNQAAPAAPGASAEAPMSTAPASTGAATGETCGTIAGIQCGDPNDYCKTDVGMCDVADAEGVCTKKTGTVCTQQDLPVCGCDGTTYGNACKAGLKGQNVRSTGKCPKN